MMNTGYVTIDCKGLDLIKGSTPQTIPGLRADIETAMATGKPIIATNLTWDEGYISPTMCMCTFVGDDLIATSSTLQIYISKSDVVTIVNLVA